MEFQKSSGQAAKIFLALAIVIFIAILIAFVVIKQAEKPIKPVQTEETTVPKAVYETTMNDIKITFQEAIDLGSILQGSKSRNPGYQKDLSSTEKFIIVTIGAQNKGKEDTPSNVWGLGNIIDSEERNFIQASYGVSPWLPQDDTCGEILKPEFSPTSCTKIYEVAKISTGLKVQVFTAQKSAEGKYTSSKKDFQLIDLIVTK